MRDVNLSLRPGEVLALIGPNGAGKTSLLNALTGFMRPLQGRVFLDRSEITNESPRRRAKRGVARTFQAVRLFESMTVFENVEVAALGSHRRRAVAQDRVTAALSALQLSSFRDREATALPYGAQRLVGIARALALEPRFLLLDEPAAGLNDDESESVASAIKDLAVSLGIGVLLVEHDMDVVMGISDRIHVLDSGSTIAEGSPEEVRGNSAVVAAYLGPPTDA